MVALDLVELAKMADLAHLFGFGIHPPLPVFDHCIVSPAAFEQLVQHLQVFIGLVVAAVVLGLVLQAHGAGGAVEVTGDDVPADPAIAQVVKGGKPPGEQVRRLVGEVGGQAKAQVAAWRRPWPRPGAEGR